jgi:hypothetical protein
LPRPGSKGGKPVVAIEGDSAFGFSGTESEALASGKPALINAVIDPTTGTESGHIQSLNPRSAAAQRT